MKKKILAMVLILTLVSISCKTLSGSPSGTPSLNTPTSSETANPEQTPTTGPVQTPPAGVYAPPFGEYPTINVHLPNAAVPGYSLPVDLAKVTGLDQFSLSTSQQSLLSRNGFVVSIPKPGKYNEFYQVYESIRYDSVPIFVSTDSVFHIYHLIFDKMLRDLERDFFIADLQNLTSTLLKTAEDQYQSLKGTSLEEPALRNVAYFGVAAQLLGLADTIPTEAADLVNQEVQLINNHQGVNVSPIWDRSDLPEDKKLIEDYSQYIPRGHYTRSEDLQKYFKTMMWYGRMTFRMRDSFETERALLLTNLMQNARNQDGTAVSQTWHDIYDPTVFIVGKSDDLSFQEYGGLSASIFGSDPPIADFGDQTKLEQFMTSARQLPPPQINSMWVWIKEDPTEATQGFRLMGQRFTLDAYVFGQMIWRKVGTMTDPRGLPKGLDFFAALGSQEASKILADSNETHYQNFSSQLEKVQTEISNLKMDSWTQNLYWSWLYAFQPLITQKGEPYPTFMRTQAWERKELQTALGSWTELKHDTILYAKQVMAEMGGGPAEEPPHGYVEPNPEAYARLNALVQMTSAGLSSRNLLSPTTSTNLTNLSDLLTFLQSTSEKELAGETISTDDYNRIRYIGGTFEALTLAAADRDSADGSYRDLNDQKAALIADVATGLNAEGSLSALEEAIGEPAEIYVVCPDQPYRVAVGAVYTYYEFPVAVADRMTDEQWQTKVEQGNNPALPDWTELFISK